MGEANRLTPGEQQTVRAFLSAARLLSEQLGQELLRETGMRQIHYEILAWLSEAPQGRLRMAELARRTAVSHSRLSHLVDRLEERRWIERPDCSDDARGLLASLTDKGAKALQEAAPWHAECVHSRLLEQLTPEQTASMEPEHEAAPEPVGRADVVRLTEQLRVAIGAVRATAVAASPAGGIYRPGAKRTTTALSPPTSSRSTTGPARRWPPAGTGVPVVVAAQQRI